MEVRRTMAANIRAQDQHKGREGKQNQREDPKEREDIGEQKRA